MENGKRLFENSVDNRLLPVLNQQVSHALDQYLDHLSGHDPHNIYTIVVEEIERVLFRVVIQHAAGNQTRAALMLGVSRGTLRKKLCQYGLL